MTPDEQNGYIPSNEERGEPFEFDLETVKRARKEFSLEWIALPLTQETVYVIKEALWRMERAEVLLEAETARRKTHCSCCDNPRAECVCFEVQ